MSPRVRNSIISGVLGGMGGYGCSDAAYAGAWGAVVVLAVLTLVGSLMIAWFLR